VSFVNLFWDSLWGVDGLVVVVSPPIIPWQSAVEIEICILCVDDVRHTNQGSSSHHRNTINQRTGVVKMDVPPEILALLANTQSIDQTLRLQAEERIRFFQNNELRISSPQLSRADLSN
jgi:hypothetical protein